MAFRARLAGCRKEGEGEGGVGGQVASTTTHCTCVCKHLLLNAVRDRKQILLRFCCITSHISARVHITLGVHTYAIRILVLVKGYTERRSREIPRTPAGPVFKARLLVFRSKNSNGRGAENGPIGTVSSGFPKTYTWYTCTAVSCRQLLR